MKVTFSSENIERLINEAVSEKRIRVYYQPKYDALNGKAVGAEALARWIDGDGKIISPSQFVPILEETGFVTVLDWYILGETCRFLRNELDNGRRVVPVSVNFSRVHTKEKAFAKTLCETVDGCGLSRGLIEVEITESAMATGDCNIIDFIGEIRNSGFSVSIDDFGSGLSSLNFVKDVPANVIKIDKSLLSGNCENEKERVVLESIFEFAHRLKMTTIAEGVETKEQLGFLRTCGCEEIQGFLFAKPMSEEDFRRVLAETEVAAETEDILVTQAPASATQLLLDVIFKRYPLIIMSNLDRNSFYMMAYENFSTRSCPSTGIYTELIVHGASTMHPEDKQLFSDTFDLKDQIDAYNKGQRVRSVVTRQLGDDGVYRPVETTNYYVKNPSSDDILAITLSRAIGE